jgi:predicted ATPase/class 3 adenylate cyclase
MYAAAVVELPDGIVTLLFTDIEGSTRLLKRLGQAYAPTLEQHAELIRSAINDHGGVELGTAGDSFVVVFTGATDAMAAALEAQRSIEHHSWPVGGEIRVRMGLHTGAVVRSGADYVGMTLHEAARIAASAHGGQIVISEATADAGRLPAGAALRSLGPHRFRDIDEAIPVLQICDSELCAEFPELNSAGPPAGALPSFTSNFIGRTAERIALRELVRKHRLLTIVGPPGVGKTRLAIELGRDVAMDLRAGVRIVELASVNSHLVDHVARSLGLPTHGSVPTDVGLLRHLASGDSMLIIDNCEHVISEVAALVHKIVAGCSRVSLVLTSREPLEVPGETVWQLVPLAEVCELFVDRVQSAVPGMIVPSDDPDVVSICARLDALPLAVELAAALVRRKSISEIARDLDNQSSFLDRSANTADDRHATLRAAIDWSYRLLEANEASLLRRLAVFAGTFDSDAASAVAATPEAAENLERLVDQSLVSTAPTPGRRHYRLLATIRAYASTQLDSSGERESAERAHARFFRQARSRATESDWYNDWCDDRSDIASSVDNHRAALSWYAVHDSAEGLAYAVDLDVLWYMRLSPREGIETIERFLELTGDVSSHSRASALAILADLYRRRGRYEEALRNAADAIAIDHRAGSDRGMVSARIVHAQILAMQGKADDARSTFTHILQQATYDGDDREMLMARRGLISLALEHGDVATAGTLLDEARAQAARLDLRWMVAVLTADQAQLALVEGDLARARDLMQTVLPLAQASGNANAIAEMSLKAARVCRHSGTANEALALLAEAARTFASEGDEGGIAHVFAERATIASAAGDHTFTVVLLRAARSIRDRLGIATPGSEIDDIDHSLGAAARALGDDVVAQMWRESPANVDPLIARIVLMR